jgi:DNA invertase Pin-like site-specific DNA recombinase
MWLAHLAGIAHREHVMGQAKRAAIYLRVSTNGQTVENQRRELTLAAERHGWIIAAEFGDQGISGKGGRRLRPAFDRLCSAIGRREYDIVAAWSVDRLGRSLQDLVSFLGELHAKGVDLYLHQQGVDTSTPAGKALFGMMGVFAEFDRSIIVERVKAGLARARAQGKRLGRPKIGRDLEVRARRELAKGTGILKVGRTLGLGTGTVQRVKRAMADGSAV